jgi:hypothetical protein
MSPCRRQEFIDAPLSFVWELIADLERHLGSEGAW